MPAGPWPPADPHSLDPAIVTLRARTVLFRVHPDCLGATEFNPGLGAGGRFHFIVDEAGHSIPALYAAQTHAAALSETVFHDVPIRPKEDRRVGRRKLEGRMLSEIQTRRGIRLVELHHPGLGRLNLEPREITDTDPSEYERTRAWSQALHDAGGPAGLVWISRLHNTDKGYTFFGDRVSSDAFEATSDPLPLWLGPGLNLVYELAEAAGITIVHG
ncbi:MAG TPA: RES family NAD+ phosphorylase [Thermoanaerobaculia bacterium]|nr:RES family NAD+ phosphorylase [Thermoanaerobaculia bacterium]